MTEVMGAQGGGTRYVLFTKGKIKWGVLGGGVVMNERYLHALRWSCVVCQREVVSISPAPLPSSPGRRPPTPSGKWAWAPTACGAQLRRRHSHPRRIRLPLDVLVDGFNADGHARWGCPDTPLVPHGPQIRKGPLGFWRRRWGLGERAGGRAGWTISLVHCERAGESDHLQLARIVSEVTGPDSGGWRARHNGWGPCGMPRGIRTGECWRLRGVDDVG